jgi:electron transfer flavoprotein alpha subunit
MFQIVKIWVDILKVKDDKLAAFTAKAYADVIHKRHKTKRKVILLSSTTDSIYLSSLVAVALEAGFASNVVGLQAISFQVKEMPFQIKHSTQLKSILR